MGEAQTKTVLVRATCSLPGLPVGYYAFVDPDDSYIKAALASQMLVLETEDD